MNKKNDVFNWRTGRSCTFKVFLHLVFVTKYRKKVFTKTMLKRTKELFSETAEQMEAELLEFNGEYDHVHLLVALPPKLSIANFVGKLKGKSSYFLRREFSKELKSKLWGNHFWSPSYCAVSAGGAPLETIKRYIEEQREPTPEKEAKKSRSLIKDPKLARLTRL